MKCLRRNHWAKKFVTVVYAASGLLALNSAWALGVGEKVDNFRLTDHKGATHELYYLSDMKAVVVFAQGNACPAAQNAASVAKSLDEKYRSQGVAVLGINSNLKETREAIEKTLSGINVDLPILSDETQLIGEGLGLKKNGEVLVINPKDWSLVYRGDAKNASAAIDAVMSGEPLKASVTPVAGCAINMPELAKRAQHAQISYSKTIAPILMEKCVACHRQGGIGPWAMTRYEMVKGFAPMVREVIRTQRMPPWHADPHYLPFSNDRGLSLEQAKTVVHWIEAGAPRGTGDDPLLAQRTDWPKWQLGEPDLVVDIPATTVPATGVIPYKMFSVENPLDHDVWIRAIDYLPGDRSVLHHTIASAGTGRFGGASLNNYVPGAGPLVMPDENGILLKKGSKFQFQMHYTTTGKEATDATKFGLYFMKDPPKYNYRAMILANPMLKIPANAKEHTEIAQSTFRKDVVVYSLHPHSHFRGKSAKFVAKLPDGTEQVLLNVPHYDFNWQSTYELKEPVALPKGTKIVYTTVFDNSAQNKANPDPTRDIRWGEQTWDEMVFGVIRYRNQVEDGSAETTSMDFSRIRAE